MSWVLANLPTIAGHLLAHLLQAVPAILAAFVLSIPIARLARAARPLRAVLVTGSSLLYAVPSLALFVILPSLIGTTIRSDLNVVVALSLYGLALLVPAATEAFAAVDRQVLDAARAQGMTGPQRFLGVELPLAGPALLAALRVVTVSTVSLVTVGGVLGVRSLGLLLTDGFQKEGAVAEVATGVVVTMLVALVLDQVLLVLGRILMPWTRGRHPGARSGGTRRRLRVGRPFRVGRWLRVGRRAERRRA